MYIQKYLMKQILEIVSKLSILGSQKFDSNWKVFDSKIYLNNVQTFTFDLTSLSKRDQNFLHQKKMIT